MQSIHPEIHRPVLQVLKVQFKRGEGPMTYAKLRDALGWKQPQTKQAVEELRDAGLVETEGNKGHSITPEGLGLLRQMKNADKG